MKVWINSLYYKVNETYTIFQFCSKNGINLPCFCYHEKLTIAGNCRICLVEANNALVVSCAIPLMDGMKIFTNSKRVRKGREGVLQFLLINHPLDCPICDQGGECDLQDIALTFGLDRGRFFEYKKRSVDNLDSCGPLIKTVMTRCIHCTRCVRFVNEISGLFDLGTLGRGSSMEIGTFIERFLHDELSANIIDLCPVGALTSMPYAFSARTWEITSLYSFDILDAMASSLRFDVVNNSVNRILPSLDESVNEEWITNKARFCYDGFNVFRAWYPKVSFAKRNVLVSWQCALNLIVSSLVDYSFKFFEIILGSFSSLDSAVSLKFLFSGIGCSSFSFESNSKVSSDFRTFYLCDFFTWKAQRINSLILFSANLRLESPLLNSKFRRMYLANNKNFRCFSIGQALDYTTFPIINLGNSIYCLKSFLKGNVVQAKSIFLSRFFTGSLMGYHSNPFSRSLLLLGMSFVTRKDSRVLSSNFYSFLKKLKKFNSFLSSGFLSSNLGFLSSSELNFSKEKSFTKDNPENLGFVFLHNTFNYLFINLYSFSIYQGHYVNAFQHSSKLSVFLPSTLFVENSNTFLNMEGRLRVTKKIVTPFKFVFSDYDIIRCLFVLKKYSCPKNFSSVLGFNRLMKFFEYFIYYDSSFYFNLKRLTSKLAWISSIYLSSFETLHLFNLFQVSFAFLSDCGKVFNSTFSRFVNNYYSTDFFCRNSRNLSLCALKSYDSNFSISLLKSGL